MPRLPLIAALLSTLAMSLPATAQTTDALLILDASGSMWGQVDGQTKIPPPSARSIPSWRSESPRTASA